MTFSVNIASKKLLFRLYKYIQQLIKYKKTSTLLQKSKRYTSNVFVDSKLIECVAGAIVGSKLYYDLTNETSFDETTLKLTKEIGDRGKQVKCQCILISQVE